jgi:PTH2 family peptidyl-tRNA hydrolase
MALIVRADLKLSRGKLVAQAAHAAVAATLTAKKSNPRLLERWLSSGARKITLEASNLEALKRLYGEARAEGLVSEMITDAGHTEIAPGTITVVAIGPAPIRSVDAITSALSLLK